MEWSTKPTTMDVKSASANLTVSKSLSANRIVSVCKPYAESLSVCKTCLSVCLSPTLR